VPTYAVGEEDLNLSKTGYIVLPFLAFFLLTGCVTTGPTETTFERARISLPTAVFGEFAKELEAQNRTAEDQAWRFRKRPKYPGADFQRIAELVPAGVKLPLIVYFHGCGGILNASIGHLRWLKELDEFVVIAPDSFARERPEYCFSDYTVDRSLTSEVTQMRKFEAVYALNVVAKLPWVDKRNIFLMGHSQGGGMTAGYSGSVKPRGRIVLNGACYATTGDGMKDDEALLTFDTGRDRWFTKWGSHCREYVMRHPKGKSIYDADAITHDLAVNFWPEVKKFFEENRI